VNAAIIFSYFLHPPVTTTPTAQALQYPHHVTSRFTLALFCLDFLFKNI